MLITNAIARCGLKKRRVPLIVQTTKLQALNQSFINAWGIRVLNNTSASVTQHRKQLNLFVDENFCLKSDSSIFNIEKIIRNTDQSGHITIYFNQTKKFKDMNFSTDARRIIDTPNAGGSSLESEVLSFELLKKFFGAKLLMTEMEVPYFPMGGSINDYVVYLFGSIIGVSVTRAMKYENEDLFSSEDANHLLTKKLNGICQSSANSLVNWDKQILHVWVMNERTSDILLRAWNDLDQDLKMNTVLLTTTAKKSKEIFINQAKKLTKRRKTV